MRSNFWVRGEGGEGATSPRAAAVCMTVHAATVTYVNDDDMSICRVLKSAFRIIGSWESKGIELLRWRVYLGGFSTQHPNHELEQLLGWLWMRLTPGALGRHGRPKSQSSTSVSYPFTRTNLAARQMRPEGDIRLCGRCSGVFVCVVGLVLLWNNFKRLGFERTYRSMEEGETDLEGR